MNFTLPKAKEDEKKILQAIAVLLGNDKNLLNFLFEADTPRLRKRAGILKEDSWRLSDEEQFLIRAALDLWNGSGHLQLWEMIETWDQGHWNNFTKAINIFLSLKQDFSK